MTSRKGASRPNPTGPTVRRLARGLAFAAVSGCLLIFDIFRALPRVRWQRAAAATGGTMANRVVGWSTWLLPAAERARYRDEFSAELAELDGESWRYQMGYALRLLVFSVQLRRVLRQPGPVAPVRQRDR